MQSITLPPFIKCQSPACTQMLELRSVQYLHTHGYPLKSVRTTMHYYECPTCTNYEYGGKLRTITDASYAFDVAALNAAWLAKYGEPYPFDPV